MLGDKVTLIIIVIIIMIIFVRNVPTINIIIITIKINWILLQEFFFGDEPALLDLVVYAHVAQLVGMINIMMMTIELIMMIMAKMISR